MRDDEYDDDRPGRDDDDDRPRRRRDREDDDFEPRAPHTNGYALWALICGLGSFVCSLFLGIPAIILGILGVSRANKTGTGRGMSIAGIILGVISIPLSGVILIAMLLPAVAKVREAATRSQTTNDAKQIGLAMQNYNDVNTSLPAAKYDPKNVKLPGNRGLSWRVGLLPFMEQDPLYRKFDLSKSWDDPVNQPHSNTFVMLYGDRTDPGSLSPQTRHQVFVGRGTAFDPENPRLAVQGIQDGSANTILFAEATAMVPWASPQDIAYSKNGTIPALGAPKAKKFLAGFGDGTVRMIRTDINPATLHLLIQAADGKAIPPDAFD